MPLIFSVWKVENISKWQSHMELKPCGSSTKGVHLSPLQSYRQIGRSGNILCSLGLLGLSFAPPSTPSGGWKSCPKLVRSMPIGLNFGQSRHYGLMPVGSHGVWKPEKVMPLIFSVWKVENISKWQSHMELKPCGSSTKGVHLSPIYIIIYICIYICIYIYIYLYMYIFFNIHVYWSYFD